ncbi:MAG: hypothetical protein KAU48_04540, partial [Candidatus Thorarchaeota archaeon]|nr:hypothetical protein [Candidatus Thorarchaeota archaeon]
ETSCVVVYPISSALLEAEIFLDNVESITTKNDVQKKFVDEFHAYCKGDVSRIEEITSIANTDNNKINKWLEENGFSIKLEPFGAGGFGVASILDLLGKWAIKGKESTVITEKKERFPGIKMANYGRKFHQVKDNPNFIIEIETRSDDVVYLMMAEEVPAGLAMVDHVEQITNNMITAPFDYDGFIFPKIDLDEQGPIDWLLGLELVTPSGKIPFYVIAQALQQTKLKMNEYGFRVKSAVAMGMLAGAPLKKKEPYVINKPFLMWITRPGLSKPLFIAYLNKDVWKDPEGLDM